MGIFKVEKTEYLSKLLKKLGYENIAFTFNIDRKEYFACSCGFFCEYDALEKKWLKNCKKDCDDYDDLEKTCPHCGNKLMYPYIELENDSLCINHSYNIIQNDSQFLVVTINSEGVSFDDFTMEDEIDEPDDWCLVYDKNKHFFCIIELKPYIHMNPYIQNGSLFETSINYSAKEITGDKGEVIADMATSADISCVVSAFDYNIEFPDKTTLAVSGLQQIADLFNEAAGCNVNLIEDKVHCLSDLIVELFLSINIGYYKDENFKKHYYKLEWCLPSTGELSRMASDYFKLKDAGINMQAKTLEEAFHISIDKLINSKGFSEYKEDILIYRRIEDAKLSCHAKNLLQQLPKNSLKNLIKVADILEADIETVIKHVVRARGVSPEQALHEDIMFSIYAEKEGLDVKDYIDVTVPWNPTIKTKYELLHFNSMTIEQYDEIVKKPTLDNFIKVMGFTNLV